MKHLFLFTSFLLFHSVLLKSQAPQDSSFYEPGIRLMAKATTADEYLRASHYFEELASKLPDHWLVWYYTGLGYIHASYRVNEEDAKDDLLDRAQPFIDRAFRKKPDGTEIHVLQAFLYQSRLQVNPTIRGLNYSQKADASLRKAVAADPGNPRAYMLMGYNVFHTPSVFGGGPKNALPLFLKARDQYLVFKPELPFSPSWGEQETREMIRTCMQSEK
jgi:tetratricopeptide (TPR) repeat protein